MSEVLAYISNFTRGSGWQMERALGGDRYSDSRPFLGGIPSSGTGTVFFRASRLPVREIRSRNAVYHPYFTSNTPGIVALYAVQNCFPDANPHRLTQ